MAVKKEMLNKQICKAHTQLLTLVPTYIYSYLLGHKILKKTTPNYFDITYLLTSKNWEILSKISGP